MSKPTDTPDFQGRTCGDCAWYLTDQKIVDGYCRRVSFGPVSMDNHTGHYRCIGGASPGDAACPAFVALEVTE